MAGPQVGERCPPGEGCVKYMLQDEGYGTEWLRTGHDWSGVEPHSGWGTLAHDSNYTYEYRNVGGPYAAK